MKNKWQPFSLIPNVLTWHKEAYIQYILSEGNKDGYKIRPVFALR